MGDPWMEPTDGDLLQSYSDMQGGLYGDNPAKRLNYAQDLLSSLKAMGVDLTTLFAPGTASEVPQFVEPVNQTGSIYGSDQRFASIFQAIEEGADPISAVRAAREQLGLPEGMTLEEYNQTILPVATQYASEKVQNQQARTQWEAENGGGWTLPDGTRAKTNPMGGNSANATASEYDLLGAPDAEALFNEYASARMAKPKMTPGAGISASAGPEASGGFGWTASAAAPSKFDQAVAGVPQEFWAGGVAPKSGSSNIQPRNVGAPMLAGGDFFANKAAKDSIGRRVDQAKNTRIRSDAGAKAERTIMALAALMQGGFPQ